MSRGIRVSVSPEDAFLFQLQAAALLSPQMPALEREYRFAPPRRWRFDFAWPDIRLAVEIEGGLYVAGRHTRPVGFARDCEKYNTAALMGWTVLRFTPDMVKDGIALEMTRQALARTH